MAEQLHTIVLPNGREITDVPVGTSRSVIMDKALRGGLITIAELRADEAPIQPTPDLAPPDPSEPLPGTQYDGPTAQGMLDTVLGNLDVPMGIAGGMVGAIGGPAGIVGGGAAGTFAGSVLSDMITEDEIDLVDAAKDTAIGVGFDVATLGAAKVLKPVFKSLGFGAKEAVEVADVSLKHGSMGSLQETQKMLRGGGGSLSAYQTGEAGAVRRMMEGLSEVGIVSGQKVKGMEALNNRIIGDHLDDLMNEGLVEASDDVGMLLHGLVSGGKKAAGKLYRQGMEEVSKRAGSKTVSVNPIHGALLKFRQAGVREFGSIYNKTTLKEVDSLIKGFDDVPNMSVNSLLDFQKKLNDTISTLGDFGKTQNTTASRELAILSKEIRKVTGNLLKNADKPAYKQYMRVNKAYGEAMDGLLPKLNANFITQADKGNYESIARVLRGSNSDQIKAFMGSIDTAYAQASLAGTRAAKGTGLETAKQAKDVIRNSYLRELFRIDGSGVDSLSSHFDAKDFAKLAAQFDKPQNMKAAQAVLGDQWTPFKRLINAMAESTKKQEGFIGSLVLRSREAGSLASGAQVLAGASGMAGGPLAALTTASAVFLTPVFLGKIASNPLAVGALLKLNAKSMSAKQAGTALAASDLVNKGLMEIIDMFSEEDRAEIRAEMRGL